MTADPKDRAGEELARPTERGRRKSRNLIEGTERRMPIGEKAIPGAGYPST